MSSDDKPKHDERKPAERVASDDPKKTQKLASPDDNVDPNAGQE